MSNYDVIQRHAERIAAESATTPEEVEAAADRARIREIAEAIRAAR
jgi:hypothetical protein